MLKKGKGKINEFIYNNTFFYNGKYRYYPTISDLNHILDEIISSNSTTNYIRITPFYINERLDMQIEFEEFVFYFECRDWFDEKIQQIHITDCLNPIDKQRTLNDLRLGQILYPLCKHNDVASYQKAIKKYKESLWGVLPKMMEIATTEMELKEVDLPFGYFCFEIHSE